MLRSFSQTLIDTRKAIWPHFVLAVPLKMNYTNEVYNLEI